MQAWNKHPSLTQGKISFLFILLHLKPSPKLQTTLSTNKGGQLRSRFNYTHSHCSRQVWSFIHECILEANPLVPFRTSRVLILLDSARQIDAFVATGLLWVMHEQYLVKCSIKQKEPQNLYQSSTFCSTKGWYECLCVCVPPRNSVCEGFWHPMCVCVCVCVPPRNSVCEGPWHPQAPSLCPS